VLTTFLPLCATWMVGTAGQLFDASLRVPCGYNATAVGS
jgi:hypothetical protein